MQILKSITKNETLTESIFNKRYNVVYSLRYYSRYSTINAEKFVCASSYETASNLFVLQPDEIYCFKF